MTKQLKLTALVVALVASAGAVAHEKMAILSAKNLVKSFAIIMANAGKTVSSIKKHTAW